MFWGLILEPGKRYSTSVSKSFHVSMAALDCSTVKSDSEIVSVILECDGQEIILCNLTKKVLQSHVDLNFMTGDKVSFEIKGGGIVHLSGYLVPEDDDYDMGMLDNEEVDDEEEEEDEEVEELSKQNDKEKQKNKRKREPPQVNNKKKKVKLAEESEEESDEDDEDEDEEDVLSGSKQGELAAASSDEDEEEDDDSDEEEDDDSDEDESIADEDDEDEDEEIQVQSKKQKTPQSNKKAQQSPNKQTPNNKQPENKQGATPLLNGTAQLSGKKNKKKGNQETPNQKTPNQNDLKAKNQKTPNESGTPASQQKKKILEAGVQVKEIKEGTGQVAKSGQMVAVYYQGRLKSTNKMFDECKKGGAPFKFRLGKGEVIKGWDVGVSGMKVGGVRMITCPPNAAYGQKGSPPQIPPNSTLVFQVELKSVN